MAKPASPPGKGGRPKLKANFAHSLVHYWPMQEGIAATSAYGFTDLAKGNAPLKGNGSGTFTPVAAITSTGQSLIGTLGGGLASSTLQSTLATENVGTKFTVGAWVRSNFDATSRMIMCHAEAGGAKRNFYLATTSANAGKFTVGFTVADSDFKFVVSTSAVQDIRGPMTLVVGTYDGANIKAYFNGRLEATTAETGTPQTVADPIRVMSMDAGSQYWTGLVAHAFIMSRPMSAGEIRLLANNPGLFIEDPLPPIVPQVSLSEPQTLALVGLDDASDGFGTLGVGVEQRLNLVGVTDDSDAFGTLGISTNPGGFGGKTNGPGLQTDPANIS